MNVRNLIFPILGLLLPIAGIADNDFRLLPGGDDGFVRLTWTADTWPNNVVGYAVKRRPLGGTWQDISTVKVEITTTADWAAREPETARHQTLIDKLQGYINQGIAVRENATMVAELQSDPDVLTAFYVQGSQDFDLPLLSGIGSIDRGASTINAWEYGIFAVDTNDNVTNQATAVAQVPPFGQQVGWEWDLEAQGNATSATLSWDPNTTLAAQYGVIGYRVQEQNGDGSWTDLLQNPICDPYHATEETRGMWVVNGTEGEERTYRVVAVNYFGGHLASTTIVYSFEDAQAYIPTSPINFQANLTEGGVQTTWSFDTDDLPNIDAIIIQRADLTIGDFADVSAELPTDTVTYTDTSLPAAGGTYLYQVVAKDATYGDRISGTVLITTGKPNQPSQPENLEITLLPPESCFGDPDDDTSGLWCQGAWKLDLNWTAPENSSVPVIGYQLAADLFKVDDITLINSVPHETTDYTPMMGQEGRNYTWQVSSLSDDGVQSTASEQEIYVPRGKLPPVEFQTFIASKQDDNIVIEWEYPELADVAGFRLYRQATDGPILLANEETITSDLREFTVEAPDPQNGAIHLQLQTISKYQNIRTELSHARKAE